MKYIYTQQNSQGMVEETEHYVDEVNIVNEPRKILEDIGNIIGHVTGDGYPAQGTNKRTATNIVKNNFNAEAIPTISDDETQGYSKGSIWIYQEAYVCLDPSAGEAVWRTLAGGSVQTTDIELYCDFQATSGDGTENNPFKTLQEAIDSLPNIITGSVDITMLNNETVGNDTAWGDFRNIINKGEINISGHDTFYCKFSSLAGQVITISDPFGQLPSGDNALAGMLLTIFSQGGMYSYTIASNTSTTITVSETWSSPTPEIDSDILILPVTIIGGTNSKGIVNFTGKGDFYGLGFKSIENVCVADNSYIELEDIISKDSKGSFCELNNSYLEFSDVYIDISNTIITATNSILDISYTYGAVEGSSVASYLFDLNQGGAVFSGAYFVGKGSGGTMVSAKGTNIRGLESVTHSNIEQAFLYKPDKIIYTLEPDATSIDTRLGEIFITGQNTQATEITSISGSGIITIIGGAGTIPSTMSPSTTFILSSVMTFDENDSLTLIKIGSKFIELARSVK